MSKSAKRAAVRDRRARRKAGAGYGGADKKANVLVTHREAGLEVLHLHTGRPVTELQLPRGMAHADINGDGAIDRCPSLALSFARLFVCARRLQPIACRPRLTRGRAGSRL